MNIEASIVIPTFNGENKISELLASLSKQSFLKFEVIVVIDGSTDNTKQILSRYTNQLENLRIIEQPNQGRSVAKNKGASLASADLLIFYDDDMTPATDSIEKHIQFHRTHHCILSGNPIENLESKKSDIQNYKAHLTRQWASKFSEDVTQLKADNLFFASANCSVPRALYVSLNGFDERLNDSEDFDFAYRALDRGIPVYFDRSNKAIHRDFITAKSYVLRQRQYSNAHQMLRMLHPERYNENEKISSGWKHWVYRFFAMPVLLTLIDKTKLFRIFPQKIRYSFYSIVIHSLSKEYPMIKLS